MTGTARTNLPLKATLAVARQLFLLLAGTLCFVVAVKGFIIPNHLLTGGVTGLSLLLHALFKWPVGLLTLLFNVPIFLLGFRDVGRRFALYSGLAVLLFAATVDQFPIGALTLDPLLASIFGGILSDMARGVTLLKAEGAYTGAEGNILLCVLTRYELRDLKDIVREEDPEAFVTVFEASDVIGRFKRPTAFDLWKKSQRKGP